MAPKGARKVARAAPARSDPRPHQLPGRQAAAVHHLRLPSLVVLLALLDRG